MEMEAVALGTRRKRLIERLYGLLPTTNTTVFVLLAVFVLFIPLGDPSVYCDNDREDPDSKDTTYCFCNVYTVSRKIAKHVKVLSEVMFCVVKELLYEAKLKYYSILEKVDKEDLCKSVCCTDNKVILFGGRAAYGLKAGEESVDKVIEDEITRKLGEDLLQSLERKFQVDLERSVDMVLIKIKLLLQNGTQHIQDKLSHIQETLDSMRTAGEKEVELCLSKKQNETSSLAEKALHQMVVCGYALIGQDPGQAVRKVVSLKNMIGQGVKPLHEQKKEIYGLLKVCGHDHDSLKKVVKCVISKSPIIKSTLMEITGKLIEGVVDLTKLMAHGAMHEACLIEVIKTIEDEATELVKEVRKCAFGDVLTDVNNYIKENNATILDIESKKDNTNGTNVNEMQDLLKKMLGDEEVQKEDIKNQFLNLQPVLKSEDTNAV